MEGKTMKKARFFIAALLLIVGVSIYADAANANEVNISVNGFELEDKGILQNNRTLVPMRVLAEALDAKVTWIEETQEVIIIRTLPVYDSKYETIDETNIIQWIEHIVTFEIGSNEAIVTWKLPYDGKPSVMDLDVPAQLINNKTMIPLRTACEALGAIVKWDSATKTAHIDSEQFYTFNSDYLPAS